MSRLTRTAGALIVALTAVVLSALPAYAQLPPDPPQGSGTGQAVLDVPASAAAHGGGTSTWVVVLIAVGAALLAAVLTLAVSRVRIGHRLRSAPAT